MRRLVLWTCYAQINVVVLASYVPDPLACVETSTGLNCPEESIHGEASAQLPSTAGDTVASSPDATENGVTTGWSLRVLSRSDKAPMQQADQTVAIMIGSSNLPTPEAVACDVNGTNPLGARYATDSSCKYQTVHQPNPSRRKEPRPDFVSSPATAVGTNDLSRDLTCVPTGACEEEVVTCRILETEGNGVNARNGRLPRRRLPLQRAEARGQSAALRLRCCDKVFLILSFVLSVMWLISIIPLFTWCYGQFDKTMCSTLNLYMGHFSFLSLAAILPKRSRLKMMSCALLAGYSLACIAGKLPVLLDRPENPLKFLLLLPAVVSLFAAGVHFL